MSDRLSLLTHCEQRFFDLPKLWHLHANDSIGAGRFTASFRRTSFANSRGRITELLNDPDHKAETSFVSHRFRKVMAANLCRYR